MENGLWLLKLWLSTMTMKLSMDNSTTGQLSGQFNYRSVVRMILCLANTTFVQHLLAINQYARFSADPREPHAMALKQIG